MSTPLALLIVLALEPDSLSDARLHLSNGNTHLAANRLQAAHAEYRIAVQLLDHNPSLELVTALNNLGTTLVSLHEYDRALPVLRRASLWAPNFLTPEQVSQIKSNTAQVLIRLGMHGQAKPLVEQAIAVSELQQSQELPYLLLSRAEICSAEADFACAHRETERVLNSVATESSLSAAAHAIRASTWQRCGKHASAVREFEAALELARQNPFWQSSAEATDLLELYSISLQKCGRRKQARLLRRQIKQRKRIDPTP